MRKNRTIVHSLNDAVNGFMHVLKTERNMRIHFVIGFCVLMLGIVLGVSRIEWIILCIVISFVFIMEMLNTVIEETVDMIEHELHPVVRIIKDAAAGAVLVTAAMALVVGFFIFSRYWSWPLEIVVFRIRHAQWHVIFIALLTVIFLVISGKTFLKRGTPFRGGPISGHSAVAFSLWTAIVITHGDTFTVGVTFLLAVLVAQSRLRAKIHSLSEVVLGSLLGVIVTTALFKIFGV